MYIVLILIPSQHLYLWIIWWFSCSLSPLIFTNFMAFNFTRLENLGFRTTYGSLYNFLGTERYSSLTYNMIQVIRRIIYSLVIVFLKDLPGIQLMLSLYLSSLTLIYLMVFQPYQVKWDNIVDILNEWFVFFIFLFLIPNVQGALPPDSLYSLGFFLIVLVLFIIVFNFAIFLFDNLKSLYKRRFMIWRRITGFFSKNKD